jgi:hypothetical protein
VTDIVDFLRARLDEDEQAAREADTSAEMVTGIPRSYADAPVAVHISRWHPARVLAEVDAKRRIIDEHPAATGWDGQITADHPHRDPVCATCADYDRHGDPTGEPYPCATLRLLALPYREEPDYRPEWAPEA